MKTLLFVDDEPRVLQGLQRQLRNMRNEWDMHFVESGPKALEFIAGCPVQVVVSDMMMPGMDGAQLLSEVMKRHPETVRLVLSGHADRESVMRLVGPAHQYLSKPCDPEEMRAAITRALAMRDLLTSESLKKLVSRIPCLPSLPALHAELTAELRSFDPSVDRVSEIISRDLAMTTKILQLANSAFFGLSQPATNVKEAVLYLGLATIRTLVLSLQVFSQFEGKPDQHFSMDALMKHCWQTSVFARRIAEGERCDAKTDDQCFLAGLLHDLGRLILAAGLPEQYGRAVQAGLAQGLSSSEAEQAEFGATHAEVGAYLLGLWGLPAPVVEAVALHHHPAAASGQGFSPVIAVHAADAFAHELEPPHPGPPAHGIDRSCLAARGLEDRLALWRERCFEERL